jgi:DNA-binding CsgD family transcriptional regulator
MLSSTQLADLARAQQLILSPAAHPSHEAWMRAVAEELSTLFRAERAVISFGDGAGSQLVLSGVDMSALVEYETWFADSDLAGEIVISHDAPYYVEEDFLRHPRMQAHTESAVYNDWYRAHGLGSALGMFVRNAGGYVPEMYARRDIPIVANVLLGGSPMSRGRASGAARSMLSLLQPALAAAVCSLQAPPPHAGFSSSHVSAVIDGIGEPLWLFDEAGRCIHQSAAAARLAGQLSEGDVLRAGAEQLARALLRGARSGAPVPSAWALEVSGERFGLAGTYLRADGSATPAVLVRAEGVLPALPSEEVLRARFGLTPQEARVALLRARGEATDAIARHLNVSIHTVRRHTEHVLAKLTVHRAAEIGPRLMALATDDGTP